MVEAKKRCWLFVLLYTILSFPALATSTLPSNDQQIILTKYLDSPEVARELSEVDRGVIPQESYSGYFTVSDTYNSNMFFWFLPAQSGDADAPIILWLQGGPGGSSLYGLFAENGPFIVTSDLELVPANVTWNSQYHMLYLDNPVGAGFSFTDDDKGYARTEGEVAASLFSSLTQFYTVFPAYSKNKLFIAGESYAGKFIPSLAHLITAANGGRFSSNRLGAQGGPQPLAPFTQRVHINLVGLSIGDGFIDPYNQVGAYAELLFNTGLLSGKQRREAEGYQHRMRTAIEKQDYATAFDEFDRFLNGDLCDCTPYVANVTGNGNYFNIMADMFDYSRGDHFQSFLEREDVRAALHVHPDRVFYNESYAAEAALKLDIMKSVAPLFPKLLDDYKVLLYSGQLDVIVGAPLTERFLAALQWSGAETYADADRMVWTEEGQEGSGSNVAGYALRADNLWRVIVRGAGHLVAQDQPKRAFEMLQRFVEGTGWE